MNTGYEKYYKITENVTGYGPGERLLIEIYDECFKLDALKASELCKKLLESLLETLKPDDKYISILIRESSFKSDLDGEFSELEFLDALRYHLFYDLFNMKRIDEPYMFVEMNDDCIDYSLLMTLWHMFSLYIYNGKSYIVMQSEKNYLNKTFECTRKCLHDMTKK